MSLELIEIVEDDQSQVIMYGVLHSHIKRFRSRVAVAGTVSLRTR